MYSSDNTKLNDGSIQEVDEETTLEVKPTAEQDRHGISRAPKQTLQLLNAPKQLPTDSSVTPKPGTAKVLAINPTSC